jgi:hypothetical protein
MKLDQLIIEYKKHDQLFTHEDSQCGDISSIEPINTTSITSLHHLNSDSVKINQQNEVKISETDRTPSTTSAQKLQTLLKKQKVMKSSSTTVIIQYLMMF